MAKGKTDYAKGLEARIRELEQGAVWARWALQAEANRQGLHARLLRTTHYGAYLVHPLSPCGGAVVVFTWEAGKKRWSVPSVFGAEDWCQREAHRIISGTGPAYAEDFELRELAIKVNQERNRVIQEEREALGRG